MSTDTLGADVLRPAYVDMHRIRQFEEQVQRAYLQGLIHGTTHLCQGQEAVSVGVSLVMQTGDTMTCTYRGHGHCIARGMDPFAAFAELFGRADGVSGGLGGSMHLTDPKLGIIGSFGIVGAGIPVAVGAAYGALLDGRGRIAVTFFGDGAANIGAFHESFNIASVWKLPVIFICENNHYGEFSRIDHTTPFEDLYRRADAYAMPGESVDGNDLEAVVAVTSKAAERARAGAGPSFIECKTYRHKGHSRTDPGRYRPKEEIEHWMARDPILVLERKLLERRLMAAEDAAAIRRRAMDEMKAASERAAQSSWPDGHDLIATTYAHP